MGRASGVITAFIMAITVYFAAFWGFDALRILTSPTYGLEDVWRSQLVFNLGRHFDIGPYGLIKLSAALGAIKLTVAAVCIVHLFERMRALFGRKTDSDLLEGALILIVGLSIAAAGPALWSGNAELVREHTITLLVAGVATALCIAERYLSGEVELSMVEAEAVAVPAAVPAPKASGSWFAPWR